MIKSIKGLPAAKKAINSGPKVVVKFFAPWCGSCRKVEKLYKTFPGKYPKVKFYQIDIDDNKDLAEQYSIQYVPTFLFYDGASLKNRLVASDHGDIIENVRNL